MTTARAWVSCLTLAGAASVATAQPTNPPALRLPRLFGDGMMFQRDMPLPIWGWAVPGAPVSVTLARRSARTTARADGAWRVRLAAVGPGGPHELSIESNGERLVRRDVLVGDVWVASGQSNMFLPVRSANDASAEIAAASDPQIRHFAVPQTWAELPETDVAGGTWAAADPEHVGDFTAVGYFFARELRKSVGVPIGLIHTSWGGSNVETWISRGALGIGDSAWRAIVQRERAYADALRDTLTARFGALPSVDPGLVDGRAPWADPALDDDGWASIAVPSLWESAGYAGMDGIGWYRTTFVLGADEAKQPLRLGLATIDDNDIAWLNGTEIGRTDGYDRPRVYAIPPSAVRVGTNVLTVRVEDGGGGGGIYGDSALLYLEVGGQRRPLGGAWKFKVGALSIKPDGQRVNKIPSVVYNRMLHPLLGFPIKGVIWYQGESNGNNAEQASAYRPLFATLIESWRREWGLGKAFPFLWVQLPNFSRPDSEPPTPARSAWATLRESQTAALRLPKTGQAVTIDVGEANDIHPRNKQDVGKRLALLARKVAYGQTVVASGPTYRRHEIRGGRVIIELDHARGLASRAPAGAVGGFAIAGDDRHFVWAQARLEGSRVVVWSDRVPKPVAVRYAWSNNPRDARLYNADGLPAAPFRTDAW